MKRKSLACPATFLIAGKQISKSLFNTQSNCYLAELCETTQQHWRDPNALLYGRESLYLYLEGFLYRLLSQPFRFLCYKETCSCLLVSTGLLIARAIIPFP